MAKVCEICQKRKVFGNQISHSVRHTKRSWSPNLRKVKAIIDGVPKRIKVCARCIRSGNVERAL